MSDPFDSVNLLRIMLEGETDADSPDSEEMESQLRENWEVALILSHYTGDSGTATENPAEEVLTDDGAAYDADEHNGRSLVIIDGNAAGNIYTIDDTTATTLVCTGDTLLTDGVLSGDAYKIFYNLKNTVGHTHDDVDSPYVVLADAQVVQAKLATSQGEVTDSTAGASTHTLPGGEYGFYPQTKSTWDDTSNFLLATNPGAAYVTNIQITNNQGNGSAGTSAAQQRYVTASGEVYWVFILRRVSDKMIFGMWQAPDHPCFGNGGKPNLLPHPFVDVFEVDGRMYKTTTTHATGEPVHTDEVVEIIVINPSKELIAEMQAKRIVDSEDEPDKSLMDIMVEEYNIDETKEPDWPDIPVTVGLPPEWEEKQMGEKIVPIKKIIPKPAYVKTASLKLKR